MNKLLNFLMKFPWFLFTASTFLFVVGILALYSASEGSWTPWAEKQLYRSLVGISIIFFISIIPMKWIYNSSYFIFVLSLVFLILVQFFGVGIGATRWINFAGFNFQPSEPSKIAIILILAKYFSDKTPEEMQSFFYYIPPFIFVGLPFILVFLQPDLGTSMMLLIGSLSVILIAGIPRWIVISGFIISCFSAPLIWTQLYDYQKSRILTFLNPGSDNLGAGYQIAQSKIALGSGGFFGKGFLMGSQSQLNYLPEKETDFVFTMIGEEFGFFGNLLILVAYFIILLSINFISIKSNSRFATLLCFGISVMIFLYVFVNVAMVTGILPVVGAPLPLISYGGTAMLTVFIGLGLVANSSVNISCEDRDLL